MLNENLDATSSTPVVLLQSTIIQRLIGQWLCCLYVYNSSSIWWRWKDMLGGPIFSPLLENWELIHAANRYLFQLQWLSIIYLYVDVFCFNLLPYFIFRYQLLTNCSNDINYPLTVPLVSEQQTVALSTRFTSYPLHF